MSEVDRTQMPESGESWDTLEPRLRELGRNDIDWRSKRAAVYVFHPGDDVLRVAKEAYALYQSENALGPAAFPSLRRMEQEVTEMGLGLMHGPPGATGDMTSGGTESILLATKTCRDAAAARGMDVRGAKLVVPHTAHLAFDKAAHYLGLEIVRVRAADDFRADVAAMADAIDERTIMLVGSAPCFPYGLIDPIPELGELAQSRELWLHVDACVGGYLNPFAEMEGARLPEWDFRVEGVRTISADLHKYGYAAKGASTLYQRSEEQRAHQIFQCDAWPAGAMTTPTVAGTRPGGAIAGAWAVMNYLGVSGYREKARQLLEARQRIEQGARKLGLQVYGSPELSLIAFGFPAADPPTTDASLDATAAPAADPPALIYSVWKHLHDRGWFSGVVAEPPGIHLMLSPAHVDVVDEYLADLEAAIETARREAAGPPEAAAPVRYA